MIISLAVIVLLFCYRKNKRSKIVWEDNCLYESSEEDISTDPILPQWLREKPEMIFKQDVIEKTHELGTGQYGSVLKGNLMQGNELYVNFALNYYCRSVI